MQQGDEAWLAERRRYSVTASNVGNALNVGYTSAAAYMRIKLGIDPEPEVNWMMLQGTKMENWVITVFSSVMREHQRKRLLLIERAIDPYGLDPRIAGSPDRLVRDLDTGELLVLECKTCYRPELRDHLPITHNLQMLTLCAIYQCHRAYYICWLNGVGIQLYLISWTPGFWQDHIYPRLRDFCDLAALRQIPPRAENGAKKSLIQLIEDNTVIEQFY